MGAPVGVVDARSEEFAGKVALVTGGSSGIGFATARSFLCAGASVVVCGRSQTRGEQAVEELRQFGEVSFCAADVTQEEDVSRLLDHVVREFGRLDHAFNNAANADAATGRGGFCDTTLEEFDGLLRASLTSVWLCMKHELRVLARDGGTIVNTSSMDAQLRSAGTGSYAAAKSGVEALTVTAAKEFAPEGIRVNAIRPGAIRTPMLERNLVADSEAERRAREQRYESVIALGRIGDPSEIADVVLWLSSARSSYVTAQVVNVDGSIGL